MLESFTVIVNVGPPEQPFPGADSSQSLPHMGEARNPLLRDDNGSRFCDAVDMEVILSQVEFVRWVLSPVGVVTALAIAGVLLSGLPGAILPDVEATASAGRTIRRQAPVSDATSHHHRERMRA